MEDVEEIAGAVAAVTVVAAVEAVVEATLIGAFGPLAKSDAPFSCNAARAVLFFFLPVLRFALKCCSSCNAAIFLFFLHSVRLALLHCFFLRLALLPCFFLRLAPHLEIRMRPSLWSFVFLFFIFLASAS